MDAKTALKRFKDQRRRAEKRGIAWEFTFKQWVDWWGEDIAKRGPGRDQLQMQRPADRGPYSPENTRKGRPKDNAKTRGHMQRLRNSVLAYQEHQAALDAAPTTEKPWNGYTEDECTLHRMLGIRKSLSQYGRG